MSENQATETLYRLIRRVRHPRPLRELMAACLRSIYSGDPFEDEAPAVAPLPSELKTEVLVSELVISGVRAVVYSPRKSGENLPLALYMHGGGFVIGCSDDTDYITRTLCHSNQMIVISVNYRLSPETVFPGALVDCETVLGWAISQSESLKIDPNCLYLAGDSAGANLAVASYLRLSTYQPSIRGLILLAPWLDMHVENYTSYNRLAPAGMVFDAAFLAYARACYAPFEEWKNPLVSPLLGSLESLPPTIAIIGNEDPLVDQTISLRAKSLGSKSTQIQTEVYDGMPHCFYCFPALYAEEKDCFSKISDFVKSTSL